MKFTFVSNYMNHHQQPFCDAMYSALGKDFTFVATMPMEKERVEMGWDESLSRLPYVRLLYEDPSAEQLIYDSDAVLLGWTGREDIAQKRLMSGKVTMRVSERLYREGRNRAISPRGLIAKYREHIRFRKKPVYMLCAGAYAAADFDLIRAYPGKLLKWGYFPPFIENSEKDIDAKLDSPELIRIVWVGRFIPLKHPEYMVELARTLRAEKINFEIDMIGDGEMLDQIKKEVDDDDPAAGKKPVPQYMQSFEEPEEAVRPLSEYIRFHGALPPGEVRRIMGESHIHIMTSNQLEGWGAVINEGMNAGCIEIACYLCGAVPFLIRDNENGLIYDHEICEEMEQVVLRVLRNPRGYAHLGSRAYRTIRDEWNAELAAGRLLKFTQSLLRGDTPELPESGPLSPAPLLVSAAEPAIYSFSSYFKF
ncbi:MAG: glycosyltransferase family 4 protein [Lachnospiraceae bacterium]|nr:glycosyltransferase family 4 protein [Lachnospiraceae bacterium]